MRKELARIDTVRDRFTATFERYGRKTGYTGNSVETLLFKDVKLNNEPVTDHIWFTMNKQFETLNLKPGDQITFNARVKTYTKGYRSDKQTDYRLSHPTKIEKR